jgi:hypothetical protein
VSLCFKSCSVLLWQLIFLKWFKEMDLSKRATAKLL